MNKTQVNHLLGNSKNTPSGYKILVVDDTRNIVTKSIYRGEDCMEKFVLQLAVIQKDLIDSLKVNKPIDMTEQDKNDFKNATECYICNNWKGGLLMVINVCVKLEIMTM